MTRRLDRALEAVRHRPADIQDAIADAMLSMAAMDLSGDPDPDEIQDALRGLAEVDRGEIATDEEIEAAFRRFRR